MTRNDLPTAGHALNVWGWLRRHRDAVLWIATVVLLLLVQWPMFKGAWYRVSGSAAPDGIGWRSDLAAALAESRQTAKPVLVDFTASWCPPCQVMKHDVWPDKEVHARVNESFIPVLIDVDAPENSDVATKYGVTSIPTILVLNGEGEVGHATQFQSRSGMLRFLGKAS